MALPRSGSASSSKTLPGDVAADRDTRLGVPPRDEPGGSGGGSSNRKTMSSNRGLQTGVFHISATLNSADPYIEQWRADAVHAAHLWDGLQPDVDAYLAAVDKVLSCVEACTKQAQLAPALERSQSLLRVSMDRLEEEFRYLLKSHTEAVEPARIYAAMAGEHPYAGGLPGAPFKATNGGARASASAGLRVSRAGAGGGDGATTPPPVDWDDTSALILLPQYVVRGLHQIVLRLAAAGLTRDSCRLYKEVRRQALEESLAKLGLLAQGGSEDVHRMQWEILEGRINGWLQSAGAVVRVLLASERRLCDSIFFHLFPLDEQCFADVARGAVGVLFGFADAVAMGKRLPERLFRESCEALRNQYKLVLLRLGEAARCIFAEFENAIERDPCKAPDRAGMHHGLTRYVVNYLILLHEYSATLAQLFVDAGEDVPVPHFADGAVGGGSVSCGADLTPRDFDDRRSPSQGGNFRGASPGGSLTGGGGGSSSGRAGGRWNQGQGSSAGGGLGGGGLRRASSSSAGGSRTGGTPRESDGRDEQGGDRWQGEGDGRGGDARGRLIRGLEVKVPGGGGGGEGDGGGPGSDLGSGLWSGGLGSRPFSDDLTAYSEVEDVEEQGAAAGGDDDDEDEEDDDEDGEDADEDYEVDEACVLESPIGIPFREVVAAAGSAGRGRGGTGAGGGGAVSQSSSLIATTVWKLHVLVTNLEGKARAYKDPALAHVFLMNNVHYIASRVKQSKLRSVVGDDWVRQQASVVRLHATAYQRLTWNKALACLSQDAGTPSHHHSISRQAIKERFRYFNLLVDETHREQATWVVPEDRLREELRAAIRKRLLPAYRDFYSRFGNLLENGRHPDKYIRYSPADLDAAISDLFRGSPAPSRSSIGPSSK
eukprot:jgi/Mesen1/6912/ME000354S06102